MLLQDLVDFRCFTNQGKPIDQASAGQLLSIGMEVHVEGSLVERRDSQLSPLA